MRWMDKENWSYLGYDFIDDIFWMFCTRVIVEKKRLDSRRNRILVFFNYISLLIKISEIFR